MIAAIPPLTVYGIPYCYAEHNVSRSPFKRALNLIDLIHYRKKINNKEFINYEDSRRPFKE